MKNINDMTEEEQINDVSVDPYVIRYIQNPSEAVQLIAVKQNGSLIYFINDPSEEVQLAAVGQHGYVIHLIKNPSKDVLITALLKLLQGGNIEFVENLLNKYSDRNYPEFDIIRKSIDLDK